MSLDNKIAQLLKVRIRPIVGKLFFVSEAENHTKHFNGYKISHPTGFFVQVTQHDYDFRIYDVKKLSINNKMVSNKFRSKFGSIF